MARGDVDAPLAYRQRAPGVRMTLATREHFAPLLVTMGAAGAGAEAMSFPITGFAMSTMTKRSVQIG